MSTWLPIVLSVLGLAGGLAGAYVSVRKLPADRGLTVAQTRNLTEQVDDLVWQRTQTALAQADERERKLLARLALVEEHVRGLERALREAGLPVPMLPYGGI